MICDDFHTLDQVKYLYAYILASALPIIKYNVVVQLSHAHMGKTETETRLMRPKQLYNKMVFLLLRVYNTGALETAVFDFQNSNEYLKENLSAYSGQ